MDEDIKLNSISSETCFVPDTNQGKERRAAVVSGMTAARYLHYGRILSRKHKRPARMDARDAPIVFSSLSSSGFCLH